MRSRLAALAARRRRSVAGKRRSDETTLYYRRAAGARHVTGIKASDPVVVGPNPPCGTCPNRREGLTNLCSMLEAFGGSHIGGSWNSASYKLITRMASVPCPIMSRRWRNRLPSRPRHVECGHWRARRCYRKYARFGARPIGLLLALSLKSRGVETVTIADINENRLGFAGVLGLKMAVSGSEALLRR